MGLMFPLKLLPLILHLGESVQEAKMGGGMKDIQ